MGHTDGYREGYRAGVEAAQAQMRLAQKATEYAMGITDPPEE
jgi:hypothetical protein